MEFKSLLYADTDPQMLQSAPDYFQDLRLDYLLELINKEARGYDLYPYYYTLPQSERVIRYRQQICQELLDEELCQQLQKFCIQMQRSRESYSLSHQCGEEIQAASYHLEAASGYWQALLSLSQRLDSDTPESEGLQSFQAFLSQEIHRKQEAGFEDALKKAGDFFSQVRFRLILERDRITIGEESGEPDNFLKDVAATALNVEDVPEYRSTDNYLKELAALTGTETAPEELILSSVFPNLLEPSCMEETLVQMLKRSKPVIFQEIMKFYQEFREIYSPGILQFEQEIPVYLSFMRFRKKTELLGYALREPQLSQGSEFYGKGLYDLALVWKNANRDYEVVSNDLTYPDHASFFVVTGPNQGGKTTFARSVGQAVYFSLMGLYANASEFTVPFFQGISTHFEVEESLQSNAGKLKEEIRRLVPMMQEKKVCQFVILNELFTTATTYDAIIMGKEVMKQFLARECHGIYVTHIQELAEETHQIISLVAQITDDGDKKRTYRMLPMKAQGYGYSDSLVREFGLQYEDIAAQLSKRNTYGHSRDGAGLDFLTGEIAMGKEFFPCLLYRDSSLEGKKGYFSRNDIIKDLNLEIIIRNMAGGDPLVADHVRRIMMIPLQTPEEIRYRQEILEDLCRHTELLDTLYGHAEEQKRCLQLSMDPSGNESIERGRMPSTGRAGEIFQKLRYLRQGLTALISLRELLLQWSQKLQAEGLQALVRRLQAEPLEELLKKVEDVDFFVMGGNAGYLFRFGGGMKLNTAMVTDCEPDGGEDGNVRGQGMAKKRGLEKLYYKYLRKNTIPVRDEVLQKDVAHLRETTAQYMLKLFQPVLEKIKRFYGCLMEETAFYKGAARFMRRMRELEIPLCRPVPEPVGTRNTSFTYLYELSMAAYMQSLPVGNSCVWKDNRLMLITGANQGGKSTFLRSYGIAQVLMQCGMPVPATRFSAPIYRQLFTHFTRSEDEMLSSGRLREELQRMSHMIRAAVPDSLFLLNESFASTTEKEGARIAEGILRASYESGMTIYMVTHLFFLAKKLYQEKWEGAKFLTAERKPDGERTFQMVEGEPGHTSYGTDLFYQMILTEQGRTEIEVRNL